MLFNDDFLEEEYTSLPPYEGTEMLPVRGRCQQVPTVSPASVSEYRSMTSLGAVLLSSGGGKWAVGEPSSFFRQAVAKEMCFHLTNAFHYGR